MQGNCSGSLVVTFTSQLDATFLQGFEFSFFFVLPCFAFHACIFLCVWLCWCHCFPCTVYRYAKLVHVCLNYIWPMGFSNANALISQNIKTDNCRSFFSPGDVIWRNSEGTGRSVAAGIRYNQRYSFTYGRPKELQYWTITIWSKLKNRWSHSLTTKTCNLKVLSTENMRRDFR